MKKFKKVRVKNIAFLKLQKLNKLVMDFDSVLGTVNAIELFI